MKKTITTLALSLPLLALAQDNTFQIEGKAKNAPDNARVYLLYRAADGMVKDSATIENKRFSLSGTTQGPTQVNLVYDHEGDGLKTQGGADSQVFYVDQGTTKISIKDSLKYGKIKGTEIQKEYLKYNELLTGPQENMDAINAEFRAASDEKKKDPAFMKALRERFAEQDKAKKVLQEQFIAENPDSYFSLLALRDVAGYNMDVAKVEPLFLGLSEEVRSSARAEALALQIKAAKKTAVGQPAPQFTQNDTEGNPVSLSDFKGKYVLLDFWASWCGPCRAENPNVVAAFNKYKDKNFTVLGVSLDNPGKKDAWLEAIEKDGLEWTQVSDLQGWKNAAAQQYGIRAIPQNYLIGPEGKILASNLRGEALHEKLAELLDK